MEIPLLDYLNFKKKISWNFSLAILNLKEMYIHWKQNNLSLID